MSTTDNILRIGIDATPAAVAPRTGVENYAFALLQELAALHNDLSGVSISIYLHAGNPFASAAPTRQVVEVLQQAGMSYRVHVPRRGYGLALFAYAALDRLHLLHELRCVRPWFQICPYIITVCDVQSFTLSKEGQLVECVRLSSSNKRAIRGASGLIAISRSMERELQTEFGHSLAMPIQVIHLGFDPAFFYAHEQKQTIRQKYGLEKYILFVGTFGYHKNMPRLIEAFARLRQARSIPHKLVLVGREGPATELICDTVVKNGVKEWVLLPGYVPDADLHGLYAGADVFAFPSLHEGFGIPLLEAMASGVVVLTSHMSAMPEIAGDAAIYVDPNDVSDIAAGLWHALSSDGLREQLIAKGRARAKQFTWQQMAIDTIHFYQKIAGRQGASL